MNDPEPLPLEATRPVWDTYQKAVDDLGIAYNALEDAIYRYDTEGDSEAILLAGDEMDKQLWAIRTDLRERFQPSRYRAKRGNTP